MEEVTRCDGCEHEDACPPGDTCLAELVDQIEHVRVLREDLESRTQDLYEKQVAFNKANAVLIEEKCRLMNACDGAEKKLREMTLAAYKATGSKRPAPGVGIRSIKKLRYDENSIKQWAIQEGHIMFLTLDRPGFEGWAKAMMKSSKLPESLHESGAAVIEIESPQATIAKEL
jgi:hypothetical protein